MQQPEQIYHVGIKAIIKNDKGEILVLKRAGREHWDIPGGRMQAGEQVRETLMREVMEETGLTQLQDIQTHTMVLTPINIPLEEGTSAGLILWYHSCSVIDPVITLSEEHNAYAWVSRQRAQELVSFFGCSF